LRAVRAPRSRPCFARVYTRLSRATEARGASQHRSTLVNNLDGRVIEIGCGNGLAFPHYRACAEMVVAIEPERYLRARASEAAGGRLTRIAIVAGVAEALPVRDNAFDHAVLSLVLCSVPNPRLVLREVSRVLRPGGELHFYEHVAAQTPAIGGLQRAADLAGWPLLSGGCHSARDTTAIIAAAGFRIERCDRFTFRPFVRSIVTAPHVIGHARRVEQ
jgi:ubiquinone/menaquinone biosynthesis C-methylase UbiE